MIGLLSCFVVSVLASSNTLGQFIYLAICSMSDRASVIREYFPQCVAVADAFRNVFGDCVRMTYAEEQGSKAGRPLDETRYTVIGGADLVVKKPQKGGRGGR